MYIKSQIIRAVVSNDKEKVKSLLGKPENKDIRDEKGNTILMLAIGKGSLQVAEFLIEEGANVDLQNEIGDTALMLAAYWGHEKIVDLIIERGAEIDKQNDEKATALHAALYKQKTEIVEKLLNSKADVNLEDKEGNNSLFYAINNSGNVEIVRMLLEANVDLDKKNVFEDTALLSATRKSYDDVTKLLLESGSDVNVISCEGKSPLINAVLNNNKDMVELLIKKGADVNVRDRYENTLVKLAALNENREIVEVLINNGAKIQKPALMREIEANKLRKARIIFKADIDIKGKDDIGRNVLMYLTKLNKSRLAISLTKIAIEKGVRLEDADYFGEGLLSYVLKNKSGWMIKLLEEKGMDFKVLEPKQREQLEDLKNEYCCPNGIFCICGSKSSVAPEI